MSQTCSSFHTKFVAFQLQCPKLLLNLKILVFEFLHSCYLAREEIRKRETVACLNWELILLIDVFKS